MQYQNGEEFLNYLNKNMHLEDIVMHTAEKSDTPVKKINKYMLRLERIHNMTKNNKHKMNILKQLYYDKYIIDELPESYIASQQKIAREMGYGTIEIAEDMKSKMLITIQKDQKNSLDSWIEYLCSDDAMYPMWFKNYAFTGMLKLGKFDKEKNEFTKRTKTTVEPYIDLNREVLAQVYNTLSHQMEKNELTEIEEQALENGESFKKLYSYYLKNAYSLEENSEETSGVWIRYDMGSDYHPLWKSLQGKNTGWCTAGEEVAKSQLENGDFYIYYTKDKNDEYNNPRIAIRMNGKEEIGEVRGISKNQNLEANMEKILEEKLNNFEDKDKYLQKVKDMNMLTTLEKKQKENIEFTNAELRFLYEIEYNIEGFGWEKDPRIEEIKKLRIRNNKKDIATIYNIDEEKIAIKVDDIKDETLVFHGDLIWNSKTVPTCFSNLQFIFGNADFRKLTSALNLDSLKGIAGDCYFNDLSNSEGLDSLGEIRGNANFSFLTETLNLTSLEYVGEDLDLSNLKDSKGLDSLIYIGGIAYFPNLTSAQDLSSLKYIEGAAWFNSLVSTNGLESLEYIGDDAHFEHITDAAGLLSLEEINGDAWFYRLSSATGLNSLKSIGRNAYFSNLNYASDLESLECIDGHALFDNLKTTDGLNSLKKISGKVIANYVDFEQLLLKNNSHYHK